MRATTKKKMPLSGQGERQTEPLKGDPMHSQFSHTQVGTQALAVPMTTEDVALAHHKHILTVRLALSDQSLHGVQQRFTGHWLIDAPCADAWARGEKCAHVATAPDSTDTAPAERWPMPSCNIATLNLNDPPAAVQDARELLTASGATRLDEPAPTRYLLESALSKTQRHEVRFGENGWRISPVQIENDELTIAQARSLVEELQSLIAIAETADAREIRRASTVDERLRDLDDGASWATT